MNIAYCATIQPKFGGLRTFNIGLSLEIKKQVESQGHQFFLITQDKYYLDFIPCKDNIVAFSGNHFWFENFKLPKILVDLDIDFAIFPHNRIPIYNKGKYKKICIFHDLLFYRYPKKFSWLKRKGREFYISNATKESDFSFSVSMFTASELKEFSNGHNSIVCLQAINKFKLEEFPDKPLPEHFKITKPYFLFFGAQSFQKNLVSLIEAFKIFKSEGYDYQLVIAGGKGSAKTEVKNSFENSSQKHDILFPGFVTEEEKICLLRNATAFVFPSIYEGFGIPLLEAFQVGTAVICSNQSCLPEISERAALEVYPDPDGLASGMKKIAEDEDLRQQLIKKGIEREKQFNWKRTASIILQTSGVISKSNKEKLISDNI